jgi:hypothetical protein
MYQYFNHPVPLRFVFFGILVFWSVIGCSSDEVAVQEVQPDATIKGPTYDMGKAAALPAPITDIFKYVPDVPKGIRARAGEPAAPILKVPTVKKVPKFKRLLRETLKDSPFHQVQYILSQDNKKVDRVIATFHRQYARKDRHEAIIEMISVRLGKPEEVKTGTYLTHRWSLPTFGLEIRKDIKSAQFFSSRPLDLVYDIRTKSVQRTP